MLGGIAGWRQVQRGLFSDDIFPAPEADGSIGFGLREGLVRAEVFVPDRPHNLDEVPTLDLREDFKRKRRFELSTNSYGLRSPAPPAGSDVTPDIPVPAPGFRVVCLGASITFGWGVSYEESYPAKLAEALGVEVVNAGAPAADHFLLSDWAAEHLAGLDPDLVLFNVRPAYLDRAGAAEVLAQAVEKVQAAAGGARVAVVMPPLSTFDLQTQDIVRELPHLGWGGDGDGQPAVEADAQRARAAVAPTPLLDLTPAFRGAQLRYVPQQPGEIAVLLQRDGRTQRLVQLPDRGVLAEYPNSLHGMAIGILEYFDADANVHEPYFFDGGHPDANGYALYAQKVAKWVREQGLLHGGG